MSGKPPAKIDIEQLGKLAELHCTIDEAAAFLGCCKRTLMRYLDDSARDPKYRKVWEEGRSKGKASLRRIQWQHANGSGSSAVQMTIHLSKHWLGETDKSLIEHTGKDGAPIEHQHKIDTSKLSDAQLEALEGILATTGGGEAGD